MLRGVASGIKLTKSEGVSAKKTKHNSGSGLNLPDAFSSGRRDHFASFNSMTPDGVAACFKVGKRTVSEWLKNKKIGYIKVGRSVRILPQHLEEFVARFNIKSSGHSLELNPRNGEATGPIIYLTVGTATTQVPWERNS